MFTRPHVHQDSGSPLIFETSICCSSTVCQDFSEARLGSTGIPKVPSWAYLGTRGNCLQPSQQPPWSDFHTNTSLWLHNAYRHQIKSSFLPLMSRCFPKRTYVGEQKQEVRLLSSIWAQPYCAWFLICPQNTFVQQTFWVREVQSQVPWAHLEAVFHMLRSWSVSTTTLKWDYSKLPSVSRGSCRDL